MRCLGAAVVAIGVACGGTSAKPPAVSSRPAVTVPDRKPAPRPVRLEFGDCAAGSQRFWSGPRPLPVRDFFSAKAPPVRRPTWGSVRSYPAVFVSFGPVVVSPNLQRKVVLRDLGRLIPALSRCLGDPEDAQLPRTSFRMNAAITADAKGRVAASSSSRNYPHYARCWRRTLRDYKYSGKVKGAWAIRTDLRYGDPKPQSALLASPGNPSAAPAYRPGRTNPLSRRRDDVAACVAAAPRTGPASGALVVELTVDSTGSVVGSKVHGTLNKPLVDCIGRVARGLVVPGLPKPKRRFRCPLAFGSRHWRHYPGIDLDNHKLAIFGTPYVPAKSMPGDDAAFDREAGPKTAFDRGRLAISLRSNPISGGPRVPLKILGPLLLRADPATSFARVLDVAITGLDVVLAERGPSGWRTVRPLVVPVLPVPAGSGARWQRLRAKPADAYRAPTLPPFAVSLFVTGDMVQAQLGYRGQLVDAAQADLGRSGAGVTTLRKKLASWRAKQLSAGRRAQVSGKDTNYARVVQAIRLLQGAGFSAWNFVDVHQLSPPAPALPAKLVRKATLPRPVPVKRVENPYARPDGPAVVLFCNVEHEMSAKAAHCADGTRPDLRVAARLTKLRELLIGGTNVSSLEPLKGLQHVRWLFLEGTQVSDLAPLTNWRKLRRLEISRTKVRDLTPLAGITSLKWLFFARTPVVDLSALAYLKNLDNLQFPNAKVRSLAPIAKLKNIERLDISGTQVTDLGPVSGMKRLGLLQANRIRLASLAPLAGLAQLHSIELKQATLSDLRPLRNLPTLSGIDLAGTQVRHVAPLAALPKLAHIDLTGTPVTNIKPLSRATALRKLVLTKTRVPLPSIKALKRLRPGLVVDAPSEFDFDAEP